MKNLKHYLNIGLVVVCCCVIVPVIAMAGVIVYPFEKLVNKIMEEY